MTSSAQAAVARIRDLCDRADIASEDVLAGLSVYEQELLRWQQVTNLVSRETCVEIWSRHFLDSIQLFTLFPRGTRIVLDFGSGGGFPAIPLSIMTRHYEMEVLLVEANRRKCAFLNHMKRLLNLNIQVLNVRAETLTLDKDVDVFTARGFAPLDRTLDLIFPHFGKASHALLQKGRGYKQEIAASHQYWGYSCVQTTSLVTSDSVILDITELQSTDIGH